MRRGRRNLDERKERVDERTRMLDRRELRKSKTLRLTFGRAQMGKRSQVEGSQREAKKERDVNANGQE